MKLSEKEQQVEKLKEAFYLNLQDLENPELTYEALNTTITRIKILRNKITILQKEIIKEDRKKCKNKQKKSLRQIN
jgi:DNA repair exonuclease SbcCD nuclease subunit